MTGTTLWRTTQGAGIPLILCHGGPGMSHNLGPVAEMAEGLACVHRFDQRGCGRSRSVGPFDLAPLIGDLEALRSFWQHDRWIVGGHSWGANLALLYALARPDGVSAVIYICGTGLRWGWQDSARQIRMARLTVAERRRLKATERELDTGDTRHQDDFLRLLWSTDFADRSTAWCSSGRRCTRSLATIACSLRSQTATGVRGLRAAGRGRSPRLSCARVARSAGHRSLACTQSR